MATVVEPEPEEQKLFALAELEHRNASGSGFDNCVKYGLDPDPLLEPNTKVRYHERWFLSVLFFAFSVFYFNL
jgi:hypothetical protein